VTLRVVPLTVRAARAFVERHHSHHHAPVGGLLACGVTEGDRLCCVAILSQPVARMLGARGDTAEVSRLASDGTRHAASKCLAAISRGALALGWRRLVSYTLLGETGHSYRAAGWHVTGSVEASERWHTRSRRTIVQAGAKVRWECGPDALPLDPAAERARADAVGRVLVQPRREVLPLLREVEP
jgi:hypothetical protein